MNYRYTQCIYLSTLLYICLRVLRDLNKSSLNKPKIPTAVCVCSEQCSRGGGKISQMLALRTSKIFEKPKIAHILNFLKQVST